MINDIPTPVFDELQKEVYFAAYLSNDGRNLTFYESLEYYGESLDLDRPKLIALIAELQAIANIMTD